MVNEMDDSASKFFAPIDWIGEWPPWIRYLAIAVMELLIGFSGRMPPDIQDYGLVLAAILGGILIPASWRHALKQASKSGKRKIWIHLAGSIVLGGSVWLIWHCVHYRWMHPGDDAAAQMQPPHADLPNLTPGTWLVVGVIIFFAAAVFCFIRAAFGGRKKNRPPQPNMRLDEVVRRITGKVALPGSNDSGSGEILTVCENLREKALLGTLAIFGGLNWRTTRPADYDQMTRDSIPAEFWRTHRIDVIGFLGDDDKRGRTSHLDNRLNDADEYYGIWFDKDEINALYPPPKTLAAMPLLQIIIFGGLIWLLWMLFSARAHEDTIKTSEKPSTLVNQEPVFVDPPDELKIGKDGNARSFTRMTPDDVRHLFDDKTENQRNAFTGKWVSISGKVENSSTESSIEISTTVTLFPWVEMREGHEKEMMVAFLKFDKDWTGKLAFLHKGDAFAAVCAISSIKREYLHLNNCQRFDQ